MDISVQSRSRATSVITLLLLLTWCVGCGQNEATYSSNEVYLRLQERQLNTEYAQSQLQDIVNAVEAMFGTPDEPHIVKGVEGVNDVLSMDRVAAAAGPVASDAYGNGEGLYRQHCVHCHGITGDGKGPTAWALNPYPRDFTRGTFKFKSTPIGYKPTDEDLRKTLMNGINGTAMPSFALLSEGEVDALIDYVKFLAVRGEVERKLIELNSDFYDAEATDEENAEMRDEFFSKEFLAEEVFAEVITSWNEAEEAVTEVPERPAEYDRQSEEFDADALAASEERGQKLYYTSVANCYSCHGPSQLGDGQVTDYDQWTKEFYDWTKTNADDYDERLGEYESAGGLPPRTIIPRNLRQGLYRGGRRPIDIFWRINNGIDGTPMPAANKNALADEDIWDIVNYVLSLPYEEVSRPGLELSTNKDAVN